MPERARSFIRVLCALLALALGVPAFAAAPASIPTQASKKASCCCGTNACCAPKSLCCVKEGDKPSPESQTQRSVPAPEPRIASAKVALHAATRALLADSERAIVLVASPAEERLHLLHGVFRT
jgi:hypothetical protein